MSKEFEMMEANRKLEELRSQQGAEKDPSARDALALKVSEQQSHVQSMASMPEPAPFMSTSTTSKSHESATTMPGLFGAHRKDQVVTHQERYLLTPEQERLRQAGIAYQEMGAAPQQAPRNVSYAVDAPEYVATPAEQSRDALAFEGLPSRGISTESYSRNQAEALGKSWTAPETTTDRETNGIGGREQETDRTVALDPPARAIAPGEEVRGQVTKSFEHDGERFYSLATEKGERVVVPAGRTSREHGDTVAAARDEVGYVIDGRSIERDRNWAALQQQQQQRSL